MSIYDARYSITGREELAVTVILLSGNYGCNDHGDALGEVILYAGLRQPTWYFYLTLTFMPSTPQYLVP